MTYLSADEEAELDALDDAVQRYQQMLEQDVRDAEEELRVFKLAWAARDFNYLREYHRGALPEDMSDNAYLASIEDRDRLAVDRWHRYRTSRPEWRRRTARGEF